MCDHFNLSKQEFEDNKSLFDVLEIEGNQVIGKTYQDLVELLKKQYRRLILVHHPDRYGDQGQDQNHDRFDQVDHAYKKIKKYIEPLKSGNPCKKVSIDSESDGHLTEKEFHYRSKLFLKLNITKEEAVGKACDELINIKQSPTYNCLII